MTTWNPADGGGGDPEDVLVGQHVRLRALRVADLDLLRTWWTDPMLAVLSGSTVRPGPLDPSVEMFRPWGPDSDAAAGLGVESLSDGELVGHVALQVDPGERAAALAMVLGPSHHGQGYESDALRLATRYGFTTMGLHQIEITAWAHHNHGIVAYSEAGFIEVERLRDVVLHDGAWHDRVVMRLLRANGPSA